MENIAKKKVLLLGIDPKFIDVNLATSTGWDANRVKAVAQEESNKLTDLGYEPQICFIDLGETAESVVSDRLSRENFDCIMIGAGVRLVPQHTVLFEKIINAVHQKAPPSSKICFNTNPGDSAEAVLRWVSN
jgi:hypothetical protein